jgi:transcriptional regulator with GAF, ATPase, and Fis domain/tetratricopeptide (TPR) repeat protein
MKKNMPDFSADQWRFLAFLAVLNSDVPIHLAGHFVPLPPGPLFEVINKSKKLGWLTQKDEEIFTLNKKLPQSIKQKLSNIITPEQLVSIIDEFQKVQEKMNIDPKLTLRLMEKAGLEIDAAEQDIIIAERAVVDGNQNKAWRYFKQAADRLMKRMESEKSKSLFLSVVLKFSNLSFLLSKGLTSLEQYLHKSHDIASNVGDQRSHALINLHLGRLFYFSGRRTDAMAALSIGLTEVEEIGDEDIFEQAAGFLGIFYLMQGLFKEALPHLEKAARSYMLQKQIHTMNPIAPVLFSYCLAYLGEFHRAIGSLDCNWRIAKENSDHFLAATLRIILSTILYIIKKDEEAEFHLKEGLKEAQDTKNALAIYLAAAPLAFKTMPSNDGISKAHEILRRAFKKAAASGIIRQFASPWILELFYEFEEHGFDPLPQLSFQEIKERAIDENNIHLQGVTLRLEAQKKLYKNKPANAILSDLKKSQRLLEQSGDIVQLSKSLIETARIELSRGNRKIGIDCLNRAWATLGGYADIFFPEDLRHLLDPGRHGKYSPEAPHESVEKFIELSESIFPPHEQDEILTRTVIAVNRFFGAERGGLFWFTGGKMTKAPELRAFCNMTVYDINAADFKPNLALIKKAFEEKRPIIKRQIASQTKPSGKSVKAILCLPVEVRGKPRAILYHDNSYLEDCFDFLNAATIARMMRHISQRIDRIHDYFQIRKERNTLIDERTLRNHMLEEQRLVYQSQVMIDMIKQIDIAAGSDSTILFLGETGVGKELTARRVHAMSPRQEKPFIVVDPTAIPETLIESELFGHEKGAFTGAAQQKKGRLELADKGTLFIDEIGELPNSIQVKLLRAIQERQFYRVGGTRMYRSDFRLIAATNRNLAAEVASGNFREDLYYRINVVPFRIPALRERTDDIPVLAKFLLKGFSQKYNRPDLKINAETERLMTQYNWPGNVREMKNIIERATLLSSGDKLEIDLSSTEKIDTEHSFADMPTLHELEKRYIQFVLNKTNGKMGGRDSASEIMGINRATLYSRMKKLGMR